MWKTRGENCPLCNAMAGKVFTYDVWASASVLPGFHLGCDCYLEKVSADYPVSDLDIFGSDFDLMKDHHFFLKFFNLNARWKSTNYYMINEIINLMQKEGISVGEALKSVSGNQKQGIFYKSFTSLWEGFFQWRVFRSLQLINKSGDGNTISSNLEPLPTTPVPFSPSQSYRAHLDYYSGIGH